MPNVSFSSFSEEFRLELLSVCRFEILRYAQGRQQNGKVVLIKSNHNADVKTSVIVLLILYKFSIFFAKVLDYNFILLYNDYEIISISGLVYPFLGIT